MYETKSIYAHINLTNYNAFQCARNGYTEEITTLLKDPQVLADINNVDEEHQAALHYAARYNHYDIVKLLVEHKAGTVCFNVISIFSPRMYPSIYGIRVYNVNEKSKQ